MLCPDIMRPIYLLNHGRCNHLGLVPVLLVALSSLASATEPAKELLDAGRVDEAIQVLQQKTGISDSDAESFNLLCRANFMIEDWDRGIAACERARNLDPKKSLYHLWLGRLYGEKAGRVGFFSAAGMAKKVRSSFERAVELDPTSSDARTDLAEFYTEAPDIVGGGKDKARAQSDALMPINPARGHWVLARVAEKDKNPSAAEREYRAAITASHSEARSWLDLANFFRYAKRFDEMEQAIHSLESSTVEHREALMHAADILLKTGRDPALAIRLMRRYLAEGPVEEGPAFKAHEVLGELIEKQGDQRAAAEQYRAALALFRNDRRAQDALNRVGH